MIATGFDIKDLFFISGKYLITLKSGQVVFIIPAAHSDETMLISLSPPCSFK